MPGKIVFVNQATGYLTIDIINEFVSGYDEIAVIYGDIRIQDTDLDPKVKRSKVIEKSRRSNLTRLICWLIAAVQTFYLLITKYRNYEIFYFSIPPFAYFSSLLLRRRFSLLMWDVYPDALKSTGISESNPVYRLWAGINRVLFIRAYRLYTVGEGPAKLMSRYVNYENIIVIPLWSGLKEGGPVRKASNPFIKDNSLEDRFIVEYSGNIGGTNNIESLIEVAKLTIEDEDILYLLIGRGTKMGIVSDLIEKHKLHNCRIMPFQPDNVIRYSLAASDIGVVIVDSAAAEVVVPSKLYNLLAVGSPVISISPATSEISTLVNRYGIGLNFERNDYPGIARFIRSMKELPEILETYRDNSLKAAADFTVKNAGRFYNTYKS
jgi:glycosyltransferase involved in cell wall biosynthesis